MVVLLGLAPQWKERGITFGFAGLVQLRRGASRRVNRRRGGHGGSRCRWWVDIAVSLTGLVSTTAKLWPVKYIYI